MDRAKSSRISLFGKRLETRSSARRSGRGSRFVGHRLQTSGQNFPVQNWEAIQSSKISSNL